MKLTQPIATSIALLLCTTSLTLAQAPDKGGGMGGGASPAPAEKTEKGSPGGGATTGKQSSPGATRSEERGGASHAQGRDQSSPKMSGSDRGESKGRAAEQEDQGKASRTGQETRTDQGKGPGSARADRDKDKGARTEQEKNRDRAEQGKDRNQARTGQDNEQRKGAQTEQGRTKGQARSERDNDRRKDAQGQTPERSAQGPSGGHVQASEKQHADVRQHLLREKNVQRTKLNVSINVGTRIPRSIRLHPLSAAIVGFAPVYRGYSYVVLEDETICIVDPQTYVIVDVIPASTQRAERSGGHRMHLSLSRDQMHFLVANIDRDRRADVNIRLGLGAELPRTVEMSVFPDRVVERIPELRTYRYVVVQDQVVIVDPDDRQVALVVNE
jgi:hypothetical protein